MFKKLVLKFKHNIKNTENSTKTLYQWCQDRTSLKFVEKFLLQMFFISKLNLAPSSLFSIQNLYHL